jgi:hypothetical protein
VIANQTTLRKMIEGDQQVVVPLYQRSYTWENDQLQQLWTDIAQQVDLVESAQRTGHFLGCIVLAPAPGLAPGNSQWIVVDGQQRLTTLFLALCAIRDHQAAGNPTDRDRINDLYLINKYQKGERRYRLLPTLVDRDAFKAVVDGVADSRVGGRVGSARAVQIRLPGFTRDGLLELGGRVRDLYALGASSRVPELVDDGYVAVLAEAVAGSLGGKVGVAPRVFLKKFVGDVAGRPVPRLRPPGALPTDRGLRRAQRGRAQRAVDRRHRAGSTLSWKYLERRRTPPRRPAPHRQHPGLAGAPAAAGGGYRAVDHGLGRAAARPYRRRQDRGGDVPSPQPDGLCQLAWHVRALRLPHQGAAQQPSPPPGGVRGLDRPPRGALARRRLQRTAQADSA